MSLDVYNVQLMRYYDEVLTNSARNYVFTGDKKWELRYNAIEPLSDQLLKDAVKKSDGDTRKFFETMDAANEALVRIEKEAISLVRQGKKDAALKLLDGHEYAREKMILSDGLEGYVARMHLMQENHSVINPTVQQIVDLERKMAVLEDNMKKEKVLAIGELAARLAHDIRNPLSIIKNSMDMLIASNPDIDEKTSETYRRIQRAVERIAYQIDDVLNFVKPRIISLQNISLNKILRSITMRVKAPDTIRIILPENDIEVTVDVVNIEIVFVNLMTNAIQAMDGQGSITITAEQDDENTIIRVSDSGPGIPSDIIGNIFDPLFTTKQTGTGLGLVSCKTIVEQHGGTISASSSESGATFTITIPR
ncbi:MAG TPA: ATP-binding protein [Candidatus Nitrosotenuis sp.]|nr:ATP-binding protein [Candidatus Nitrosotenuis sp.]